MAWRNSRKNKFGVSSKADRTMDNIVFDSKKEMMRYAELKALQEAGEIYGMRMQPRFDVVVNEKFICFYKADFWYECSDGSGAVVEDVKGKRTQIYKLKKKLVEAIHGIEITEI